MMVQTSRAQVERRALGALPLRSVLEEKIGVSDVHPTSPAMFPSIAIVDTELHSLHYGKCY